MDPLLLWGIGLLAGAFLVLLLELFLPSAGVLLLVSGVLAVSSIVCLFRYETVWGVIGTLIVVVGGPTMGFFGLQIMPHTPIGKRMILGSPNADGEDMPPPSGNELDALLGLEGEVVSDLRPVGSVKVAGKRYDAISDTGMLRAGTPIRVSGVQGSELRVRKLG